MWQRGRMGDLASGIEVRTDSAAKEEEEEKEEEGVSVGTPAR